MDDENLEIHKNEEKDVPAQSDGASIWSKLLSSENPRLCRGFKKG